MSRAKDILAWVLVILFVAVIAAECGLVLFGVVHFAVTEPGWWILPVFLVVCFAISFGFAWGLDRVQK